MTGWLKCTEKMPQIGSIVLAWGGNMLEQGGYFICQYFNRRVLLNDTYPNDSNYRNFNPSH